MSVEDGHEIIVQLGMVNNIRKLPVLVRLLGAVHIPMPYY